MTGARFIDGARVVPLTAWACMRCGTRTPGARPAECCDQRLAIRVSVLDRPAIPTPPEAA